MVSMCGAPFAELGRASSYESVKSSVLGCVMSVARDRETKRGVAPQQAWTQHEQVSPQVELEAKKLVQAAGSAEMAKQAIDATEHSHRESRKDEDLALALGFVSFRSLLEASIKGANIAGYQWFLTAIRQDEWILWNDRDLEVIGVFETKEEALRAAG